MPQYCYQNYFLVLKNLSIAKKAVIAKVYSIVTILKLKPNHKFNPKAYKKIRSQAIFLLQNLRLLITIFLSNLAIIKDVMHIVWLQFTLF